MTLRLIVALVDLCRRNAVLVVLATLIATGVSAWFASSRLGIDADTDGLISEDLDWRQREKRFDRLFPQNANLIAIVIDGRTPDLAGSAAAALADRLRERPDLFASVRRPDGNPHFVRNGLLYLGVDEVQRTVDQVIAAQPLIGTLAEDPTLRGLFAALGLALEGVVQGETDLARFADPLERIAQTAQAVLDGQPASLSWQGLFTGREPKALELRRFVLAQAHLAMDRLQPGELATAAVRDAVRELGLTPEAGIRVRLTGNVPLADEEFGTLSEGAELALGLSGGLTLVILILGLRSWRLVVTIVTTLVCGLLLTAGFAAIAVGSLNLISVAFAVLFIGLAVDFGIQFCTRYRDQRYQEDRYDEALRRTAGIIGAPLGLAAAATAIGFYAFVPTAYSGVSELGIIAGTSMVIAFVLNMTMLPALLTLMRPRGEPAEVGFTFLAPLDEFLVRRRRAVLAFAGAVAIGCLALMPWLRFDFNPLNLKDPKTESVSTLFDLMASPTTSPYTIDVLAPSAAAAMALAARLEALPEVAQALTIASFVPEEQAEKLELIEDARLILGPTLEPPEIRMTATPGESADALALFVARLDAAIAAAKPGDIGRAAARRAREVFSAALSRQVTILPALDDAIAGGLPMQLELLRQSLMAAPVSVDTLPADLRREWVAPDGTARIEVRPTGDGRDNMVLRQFVAAVRGIAPEATGTPVSIQESGATISGAFERAGLIAVGLISVLLFVVLRRLADVVLVIAPLVLAAILTAATSVLAGLPLNFANVIALPLLLGIGVAFDIYFVMNHRAGLGLPLRSSTTRAVVFSALTTSAAFGSLAASTHPGTAEMGILLTIALAHTLLCTLLVLPSLMAFRRVASV